MRYHATVATALITIDQLTNISPIGVTGRARNDLDLGQPVIFRNADDTDVNRWRWALLDSPIGSVAALSSVTSPQVTFTPDVAGSYRVRLTINDGLAGEQDIRVGAVLDANGLRIPSTGERAEETNWLVGGSENENGWGKDVEQIIRLIATFANGLGATLSLNNATQGNDILITNGDSIVGEDGGALAFEAVTGNIVITGAVHLAGAASGDGNVLADDLVIGDGSGDFGLTIYTSTTGAGRIVFVDTAAGAQGFIGYEHNNTHFAFGVEGSTALILSGSDLSPNDDGDLSLGDAASSNCFNSLQLLERASQPVGINATHAAVWAKDDADPNTLYFTDDNDDDHPLSLMETLVWTELDFNYPAGGTPATPGFIADRPVANFSAAATNEIWVAGVMPREYTLNRLTLRIHLVGAGNWGAADSVEWDVSFEKLGASQLITAPGWGTATQVTQTPGVTNLNVMIHYDIVIPLANRDSIAASSPFQIRLRRLGADVADDYGSIVSVLSIALIQDP